MSTVLTSPNGTFMKLGSTFLTVPLPSEELAIGNQIWKSVNLNIDDGQGGITIQTVDYGNGPVNEYFYTWNAAVRVAESIPGWHLPSLDEWNTLLNYLGSDPGKKLKSTYGWDTGYAGTDDYGFAAFPAGQRYNGGDATQGKAAYFWTSTPYNNWGGYRMLVVGNGTYVSSDYMGRTLYSFTVRLIKDS